MQIKGKTVLLTGATGGIGEAIARELSRAGANLIVSGRRADVLERIAAVRLAVIDVILTEAIRPPKCCVFK